MTGNVPDSPMVDACRRRPVARTPVWIMRQAGRYLPEYRALREKHSLLDICRHAELAAEVALQPIRRFELDAAIVFADILLPLVPMGVELDFVTGKGPVIGNPILGPADVDKLQPFNVEEALEPTLQALATLRSELPAAVAVVGFAGGPFTLASYLIEGGPSRRYLTTKRFMYEHPEAFDRLLSALTGATAEYLLAQAAAGADVLQVFDSWAGCLGPDDYRRYVYPHALRLFREIATSQVPTIHFGVGALGLLELLRDAGGDVIGLDWRVPLDEGWRIVGHDRAVQGNLDPAVLFAPPREIEARVREILSQAGGRPGHIFNLGHGILPSTPPDAVRLVVDTVHEVSAASA